MFVDLIKPPTDNLYKFLAMFGTIVFLVGFIFPPMMFYQSSLEFLKSLGGDKELAVHEEFAVQRKRSFEERKRQLAAEAADLQNRLARVKNDTTSSSDIEKLELAIKDVKKRAEALEDASYEFNLNLKLKAAQVEQQKTLSTNETRNSRFLIGIGWGIGTFGLLIAICGFIMWYKNVQRFEDQILRKEAAKPRTPPVSKDAQEKKVEASEGAP